MGKAISTTIQIRFSDVDLMGHVNNATYLQYFELARMDFFKTLLGENWDWNAKGILLANNTIDYLKPVRLQDSIEIDTQCIKIGNKSLILEYNLYVIQEENKIKCTRGTSTLVCFDYTKEQTISVPAEFKNNLV